MSSFLSLLALGFFLGMRHATDSDHVVAVTTIVSRQRRISHAALIGVLWGVGHTVTILVVGSAIILFGVVIPPRMGLTMELSVGLMLIFLGILNLSGIMRWISETLTPVHSHLHPWSSGQKPQENFTNPAEKSGDLSRKPFVHRVDQAWGQMGWYQFFRPLAVGIVHGLAGSAAVALLVLTTIRAPMWAVLYLLVFGVGTIAGMMLITAAIALPFAYSLQRFNFLNRGLSLASGLISFGLGLFIVYQIGFLDGLFSAHPHWIPH